MTRRLDFIDVSHWQGDIDFAKVRDAGVLGVILKATEGTTYADPNYDLNRAHAQAAGLAVASYHFLKPGDWVEQMAHYVGTALPVYGERVVLDYEDEGLRVNDLNEALYALIDESEDRGLRLQITVYGSAKLTEDVNSATAIAAELDDTSLWIARYSDKQPEIATHVWGVYSAWQYSEDGTVPGIEGPVDLNEFNGSRENCLLWFGPVEDRGAGS